MGRGTTSIRLVEQNFALFSKEPVDLALGGTRSHACQMMIHVGVEIVPTDSPNMTSQVQKFFTRHINEPETIREN